MSSKGQRLYLKAVSIDDDRDETIRIDFHVAFHALVGPWVFAKV